MTVAGCLVWSVMALGFWWCFPCGGTKGQGCVSVQTLSVLPVTLPPPPSEVCGQGARMPLLNLYFRWVVLRGGLSCEEANLRWMVFGQGMSVFRSKEGVFKSVCVWLERERGSVWIWLYVHTGPCLPPCVGVYARVCPPAPSLGRRQSQRWGCTLAAPAASQANLGGEKHFDPGLQVWGSPAGGSAALQSILDLFLSHLQAPHTPQRGSLSCTLSVP